LGEFVFGGHKKAKILPEQRNLTGQINMDINCGVPGWIPPAAD